MSRATSDDAVMGPDYCLECRTYMALTDGACPKCGSKNYIKWAANNLVRESPVGHKPSLPSDPVNPSHYKLHPSGVECITITEHMTKNLGCAVDYIWRFPHTQNLKDLEKARWYIEREIQRLGGKK